MSKIHTYIHMFKTGVPLTVIVDFGGKTPKITTNREVTREEDDEYLLWRTEILVPQIIDTCTDEQQIELITKGFNPK